MKYILFKKGPLSLIVLMILFSIQVSFAYESPEQKIEETAMKSSLILHTANSNDSFLSRNNNYNSTDKSVDNNLKQQSLTKSSVAGSDTFPPDFVNLMEAPADLLLRAYEQNRVLVFAFSNHATFKRYLTVTELIRNTNNDPRLKHIVLERNHDVSDFYNDLSARTIDDLDLSSYFEDETQLFRGLCLDAEWRYSAQEFMSVLKELNSERVHNPITVTTVDGVTKERDIFWPFSEVDPSLPLTLDETECTFGPLIPLYTNSGTREDDTKQRFVDLYQSLQANDKMIVLYHHAHTLQGFNACMAHMTDDIQNWESKFKPLTWLNRFFEEYPEERDRFAIILVDEKDPEHNPNGVLKLSVALAEQFPGQSFGITTEYLLPYTSDIGTSLFMDGSFIASYYNNKVGEPTIAEMVDGLIWNHDSNAYLLHKKEAYLSEICP